MGNLLNSENNNKKELFGSNFIQSNTYDNIQNVIFYIKYVLDVDNNNELNDNELNDNELNDNKLENTELYKNILEDNDDDEEIILFLKTFYKSTKMSLNLYYFNSNKIQIFRFDKNLENKIKFKLINLKNVNYPMNYNAKLEYSKNFLRRKYDIVSTDVEIVINN
jgi:hypothetical protein